MLTQTQARSLFAAFALGGCALGAGAVDAVLQPRSALNRPIGDARFAAPCAEVATAFGKPAANKGAVICQADGGEHLARPLGAAIGHARLVRFSRWVSLRNRLRRFLQ